VNIQNHQGKLQLPVSHLKVVQEMRFCVMMEKPERENLCLSENHHGAAPEKWIQQVYHCISNVSVIENRFDLPAEIYPNHQDQCYHKNGNQDQPYSIFVLRLH